MKYVNLYIQTEYSFLNSQVRLDKLIDYAKENNLSHLGICDINSMHGVIKFHDACVKSNIKPIIGLTLTLESEYNYFSSVVLFARNYDGYLTLMKLSTIRKLKNKLLFSDIISYLDNIYVVLPNEENELLKAYYEQNYEVLNNLLKMYKKVNNLYVGLDFQTQNKNKINDVIKFLNAHNIKQTAFHKVSYIYKDDFKVYKILKCIQKNVKDFKETEKEKNSYILNELNGYDLFRYYKNLLDSNIEIANNCNVSLKFDGYKMPIFDKNKDAKQYLFDLSVKGLEKRLINNKINKSCYQKYIDRLKYELSIISKMNFCDYFLIVYDLIRYAKTNKILCGPGRGSAPSSLVAYSLGITEIDPIKYDLFFERFLNPERSSMPDIDMDFPDVNRVDIIKYAKDKYGAENVASICTFGTYGPKSAIRDVARVKEIKDTYLDEILFNVSDYKTINDALSNNNKFKRLFEENEIVNEVCKIAMEMETMPKNISIHASGIIISDKKLTEYTPLDLGNNGLYKTQYDAIDLEKIGLVKLDFLSIDNLTTIDKVLKSKNIDSIMIYKLPLDDAKTYEEICKGNTDGVFQLESAGMKKTLRDLKTSSFEDIVNALALYRPGPMEWISTFVNRKFNKEKVHYYHKDLEDILKSTYGIIVYQEQILQIANKFSNYTLGEADVLRRAISKKKKELLEKEKEKFIYKAQLNGHTKEEANQIFELILNFANYGFNKSHAVSYAYISYYMSYLKTHAFKEFMAVMMSDKVASVSAINNYILECNKNNIEVLVPSINKSEKDFVCEKNNIYYSLLGIKGLGNNIVNSLLDERNKNGKYDSYDSFICRTKDILNKKQVESLINSGALDEFNIPRKAMNESYEQSIQIANYQDMFKDELSTHKFSTEEYTYEEIANLEYAALGLNLKFNIFKRYYSLKQKYKTTNINKLQTRNEVYLLFIIKSVKEITTKNNDKMAFVSVYDDTGVLDCVIFATVYQQVSDMLQVGKLYIAKAKIDMRNDTLQAVINKIANIN